MTNRRRPLGRNLLTTSMVTGLLFVACKVGLSADSDVPRYWLKLGQELSYRTTSEFSTANGDALASESTWQVWVVKQNSDGSWRLILRHAASFQPPPKPAKPAPNKKPPAKLTTPKPSTGKPVGGKTAPKPAAATTDANTTTVKPAK